MLSNTGVNKVILFGAAKGPLLKLANGTYCLHAFGWLPPNTSKRDIINLNTWNYTKLKYRKNYCRQSALNSQKACRYL